MGSVPAGFDGPPEAAVVAFEEQSMKGSSGLVVAINRRRLSRGLSSSEEP